MSSEATALNRQQQQQSLLEAIAQVILSPKQRAFYLFGDETSRTSSLVRRAIRPQR
jgi:hypothetical protein